MITRLTYLAAASIALASALSASAAGTPAVARHQVASAATPTAVTFPVRTVDGLELPARVAMPARPPKKVLVFINGSTPSDEAGHIAAMFDAEGKPYRGRHDTYARFLSIMPSRGYAVASMAKRSYVYPHRRPRPGLDDFARDLVALINELQRRSVIGSTLDLVLVGYSEGSLVASKVLGLLDRPVAGCVLLGAATGAIDFTTSLEQWPFTASYRARGWNDDRLLREFERQRDLADALSRIDEATFEQVWKNDDRRGLAPWESYAVARETRVYDPVPNLLRAKVPVLMCVGSRDTTMPVALARGVYDRLVAAGGFAVFHVIDDEVHQYLRYDLFLILDAWVSSGGRTAEFAPTAADRAALDRAAALASLTQTVGSLPWAGEPERAAASLAQARTLGLEDGRQWFKLGMLMADARRWDDALVAFQEAIRAEHDAPHGPMTWAGHVCDLKGDRTAAVAWYRQALAAYNGIPLRHDHLGMIIDRAWIERRLSEPYGGPPPRPGR